MGSLRYANRKNRRQVLFESEGEGWPVESKMATSKLRSRLEPIRSGPARGMGDMEDTDQKDTMTSQHDVKMQWVVYRVHDFVVMNMYYLEADARKKCRRRNNQTTFLVSHRMEARSSTLTIYTA